MVPTRFLIRPAYSCPYIADLPSDDRELFDLPPRCRLDNLAALEGVKNFADVRLAWNESGLALQATVTGKEQPPAGDVSRPRSSDGVTLWLDTRDARANHRASRYCHQMHFLAAGGGSDRDEPVFAQSKINRAQQDAPFAAASAVPFVVKPVRGGYRLAAFLPAAALTGYDPEEHRRLGVYYAVKDQELGEQVLSVGSEFPFAEDPSLWAVLELVR